MLKYNRWRSNTRGKLASIGYTAGTGHRYSTATMLRNSPWLLGTGLIEYLGHQVHMHAINTREMINVDGGVWSWLYDSTHE